MIKRNLCSVPVVLAVISIPAIAAEKTLPPCDPHLPVPADGCLRQEPAPGKPAPPLRVPGRPVAPLGKDSPAVIKPPPSADKDIVKIPPASNDKMPVVPPPTNVEPK